MYVRNTYCFKICTEFPKETVWNTYNCTFCVCCRLTGSFRLRLIGASPYCENKPCQQKPCYEFKMCEWKSYIETKFLKNIMLSLENVKRKVLGTGSCEGTHVIEYNVYNLCDHTELRFPCASRSIHQSTNCRLLKRLSGTDVGISL